MKRNVVFVSNVCGEKKKEKENRFVLWENKISPHQFSHHDDIIMLHDMMMGYMGYTGLQIPSPPTIQLGLLVLAPTTMSDARV